MSNVEKNQTYVQFANTCPISALLTEGQLLTILVS